MNKYCNANMCYCQCHILYMTETNNEKIKIIKNDEENLENIYLTNSNVQLDSAHYKHIEELTKRIEKLENFIPDVLHDFEKRISGLEKSLEDKFNLLKIKWCELENEINTFRLLISNYSKKPHTCPLCDGEGINKNKLVLEDIRELSNITMKNPVCISCEGKGIVWG